MHVPRLEGQGFDTAIQWTFRYHQEWFTDEISNTLCRVDWFCSITLLSH